MRLFIAIQFDVMAKADLLSLCGTLRARGASGRFTQRENLHLTLAFLGELPETQSAESALERLNFSAFTLRTTELGCFHRGDGDICWLGLAEDEALLRLQRELCASLEQEGLPYDKKTFRPHLTLARDFRLPPGLSLSEIPAPEIRQEVYAVCLMESTRINGKLAYIEKYRKMRNAAMHCRGRCPQRPESIT